uniref:Si:ch211-180a12.2 n=1 Tax=Oryzias latipes TaxID=8090 RepID=A0A3B3HD43_ORYLA
MSNFNCLYTPLTTVHLPYGLTLTSPASEKGPLLTSRGKMGYYKLHTQGPLHSSRSGTQQLISALTFIPQISLHKGAVFKCQVSYIGKDKIVQERVKVLLLVCFSDSLCGNYISAFFASPDVISMKVSASHFHPDVITFRWFCQGGELSPVASEASSSPRPNAEGLFSAYSQCKLPRGELEKGATKVWVKVHHIALKHPIARESRGKINIKENVTFCIIQTATLGCEITDFYPPNVSVTWLSLRGGEEDDREEEVIEGGELWGPIQIQSRRFRATASLERRLIHQEKERRGGIICRVDHCSLSEPIEKHWRYGGNGIKQSLQTPPFRVLFTNLFHYPDTKGIEYIDEREDEKNPDKDEETISEEYEESDTEKEDDPNALHINRVNLMKDPKEKMKVRLQVCLEITHPALKLPVYRHWTGKKPFDVHFNQKQCSDI